MDICGYTDIMDISVNMDICRYTDITDISVNMDIRRYMDKFKCSFYLENN